MNLSDADLARENERLRGKHPQEIAEWALRLAGGRAVISTNFRPYEAVLLHLATRIEPDLPVIWVDHGFNRAATYRHAEALARQLQLNLKVYTPVMTEARYKALHGPPPTPEQEAALREFSAVFKLEPFHRAMRELAPAVWLTALRRVQNPQRAQMDPLARDANFNVLKVSPVLEWTDADMEAYLQAHGLPNEWDYFDPAKADEKRECGLHVTWQR